MRMIPGRWVLLALALGASALRAASKSPDLVPLTPARLAALKVAPGCALTVWAEGLTDARMMRVAPSGTVYLSRPTGGVVEALRDADGDGRAESRRTVISGHADIHGLALAGDRLLTATPTTIFESRVAADGRVSTPRAIATGLPDERSHNLRTLGFGPDGRLFCSVGASCNVCVEESPELAALLVMKPDGTDRRVFASGLRNTIGFDWHPDTHELWGMDHGSDDIGDDRPPEELNRIVEGADYGWPWAWGDRQPHPLMPDGETKRARSAASTSPIMGFPAHWAPIAFLFYPRSDGLPGVARGDAFIAFHGSWNRAHPQGYKVVHVTFRDGKPVSARDLVAGFLLDDDRQCGRPTGLAVQADGSLLIADDNGGRIFRLARKR